MAARGAAAGRAPDRDGSGKPPRVAFGSLRFYLILVIVAIGLHAVDWLIGQIPFAEARPDKEVSLEFQKRQLDFWSEMNKLLITLATVTIGAVGGFMLQHTKTSGLPQPVMRRAAASWIFCALSIYFGYLSYHEASWMLSLGTFSANNPLIWWPSRAQFWTFLISVILFADFVYGSVRHKHPIAE